METGDTNSMDDYRITAAEGWLMLDNPAEAEAELQHVSSNCAGSNRYLDVLWQVRAAQKNWSAAFDIACQQLAKSEKHVAAWIHRAFAARRKPGGSLTEAFQLLQPAVERFPSASIVPYNLACYSAQLNQPDEAMKWFHLACRRSTGGMLRAMALADEDLKPVWDRIAAETHSRQ